MKNKLKIIVLLISFISVLNLTGCTVFTQPGGHFYGIGGSLTHFTSEFETIEILPSLSNGKKLIISSKSEADEVFGEAYYNEEQPWTTDEFFEDNQIVCFIVVSPDTSYSFKLLKTSYNGSILTVTLEKSSTGIGLHVIGYLLAIIEIEKVPTDTVVEIEYKSNWWK